MGRNAGELVALFEGLVGRGNGELRLRGAGVWGLDARRYANMAVSAWLRGVSAPRLAVGSFVVSVTRLSRAMLTRLRPYGAGVHELSRFSYKVRLFLYGISYTGFYAERG